MIATTSPGANAGMVHPRGCDWRGRQGMGLLQRSIRGSPVGSRSCFRHSATEHLRRETNREGRTVYGVRLVLSVLVIPDCQCLIRPAPC